MTELWSDQDTELVAAHFETSRSVFLFTDEWSARNFEVLAVHPALGEIQRNLLCKLIEARLPFPYQTDMGIGRSLYGTLRPPPPLGEKLLRGVKIKGAGGLVENGERTMCRPPRPNELYGTEQLHLKIGPNLVLTTVQSVRKALLSLHLIGAQREFETHKRLARSGLGFRPLLYGTFLNNEGGREVDCVGNETGAVALEHDPSFLRVSALTDFSVTDESVQCSNAVGRLLRGVIERRGLVVDAKYYLIENYLAMIQKMSIIKRRAAVEAHVARHGADTGNFFYSREQDTMYLTDTDSCMSYETIEGTARGAQLLRDAGNDLFRFVRRFTYCAYTPTFENDMEKYNPFEQFFSGFFEGTVPERILQKEAHALNYQCKEFSRKKKKRLDAIASLRPQAAGDRGAWKFLYTQWAFALQPFLGNCLKSVFHILQQSSLRDQFPLAPLKEDVFSKRVDTYMREDFIPAMHALNERLLREQGVVS